MMSILSQLFSPADLQRLDEAGLRTVRETIRAHFIPSLDTTRDTTVKHPGRMTQGFIDVIRGRAQSASQQLGLTLTINTGPFNPRLPLFRQLFSEAELANITTLQREILETAISCEVINFNFYNHLQIIKEFAYEAYVTLTGQTPAGPNTFYSPFNLNSPLGTIINPDIWPRP
jgi:hypothetical protein